MLGKLASGVVGLFCATALFWLGIAFEHRPAGFLSFHVWGPLGFKDPGGPAAQLVVLQARERAAGVRVVYVEKVQAAIAAAAQIHDVQAVTRIRTVTRTLIKEIPVAITPATDRAFPLSVGFVRLHDAFARGALLSEASDTAGRADDAASDVKSSDAIAVIGGNYGECRVDRQRFADLQAWLRSVSAVQ